jgi:hypothetical protein
MLVHNMYDKVGVCSGLRAYIEYSETSYEFCAATVQGVAT